VARSGAHGGARKRSKPSTRALWARDVRRLVSPLLLLLLVVVACCFEKCRREHERDATRCRVLAPDLAPESVTGE